MADGADLHTVALSGTPRQRGQIHGEALRPQIAEGMRRWRVAIGAATGLDADAYLGRLVEGTDFMPAIERGAPQLLDEVRGIGEGAGLSFRDIYTYQLVDEEWLFRFTLASKEGARELDHCSTIGVFGQGNAPPLLAQNMDLPKIYDGTQALLRLSHHDSDLEALVFTPAGLLAATGLNNQAVGICCNTLAQLRGAGRGLPVAFIVRSVLEQRTVADAERFLRAAPHASGQNYMVGGPDRIVDLECSATRVVQSMPETTRLYHTNHPLANDDQPRQTGNAMGLVFGRAAAAAGTQTPPITNSEQRLAFLEGALADRSSTINADAAESILSSCEVPILVARGSSSSRWGGRPRTSCSGGWPRTCRAASWPGWAWTTCHPSPRCSLPSYRP